MDRHNKVQMLMRGRGIARRIVPGQRVADAPSTTQGSAAAQPQPKTNGDEHLQTKEHCKCACTDPKPTALDPIANEALEIQRQTLALVKEMAARNKELEEERERRQEQLEQLKEKQLQQQIEMQKHIETKKKLYPNEEISDETNIKETSDILDGGIVAKLADANEENSDQPNIKETSDTVDGGIVAKLADAANCEVKSTEEIGEDEDGIQVIHEDDDDIGVMSDDEDSIEVISEDDVMSEDEDGIQVISEDDPDLSDGPSKRWLILAQLITDVNQESSVNNSPEDFILA